MANHQVPYIVQTGKGDRIREIAARASAFGVEFLVTASQYVTLSEPDLRERLLGEARAHFTAAHAAGAEAVRADEWWQGRGFARGRYGAEWEYGISWEKLRP